MPSTAFLAFADWPGSLVSDPTRWKSAGFRMRDVPSLHPIPGRTSLFPSSSARSSIGFPCGSLSLSGGLRISRVPRPCQKWGRAFLSARSQLFATGNRRVPVPATVPFGSGLSAPLACSCSRRLAEVHLGYPYHSLLALLHPGAGRSTVFSRFRCRSCDRSFIVPGALHRPITIFRRRRPLD